MFEPHEGTLQLKHKFQKAYDWLKKRGPTGLKTKSGTDFVAQAEISTVVLKIFKSFGYETRIA